MASDRACRLPSLAAAAREVESERERGASWALLVLARGLLEDAEAGADLCGCTGRIGELVYNASHDMAAPKWVARVVTLACRGDVDPVEAVRSLVDYQARSAELAASNARRILEGASLVLTLSYSSSVERSVRQLGPRLAPPIVVLESRPGGEGALLASGLQSMGYNVRVVPDLEAGFYLRRGAVVLLGADQLRRDGCLVNKVGSRLLALAARQAGARVYAVLDATKVEPDEECRSPLRARWPYDIEGYGTVEARVFDEVSPELLSGLITEAGLLEPGEDSVELLVERLLSQLGL